MTRLAGSDRLRGYNRNIFVENFILVVQVGEAVFQIASIPLDPYNILGACDSQSKEEQKKTRTSVLLKFMFEEMLKPFDDPEV